MNRNCLGCTNRQVGCHSECDTYQATSLLNRLNNISKHKQSLTNSQIISGSQERHYKRNRSFVMGSLK